MQKNKFFFSTLLVLCLVGCDSKKELNCTNEEAISMVTDTFREGNPEPGALGYPTFMHAKSILVEDGTYSDIDIYRPIQNEGFIAINDKMKINVDNIITRGVDNDTGKYQCSMDVKFTIQDNEGEDWNFTHKNYYFNVFPMNGGEKIGIEYIQNERNATRTNVIKNIAKIMGFEQAIFVIFNNEELKILEKHIPVTVQQQKEKIEEEKMVNELHLNYFDPIIQNELKSWVENLVAREYFNGKIVPNSRKILELYSSKSNLNLGAMDEIVTELLSSNEDLQNPQTDAIRSKLAKVKNLNDAVVEFISMDLSSSFTDNDAANSFCLELAKNAVSRNDVNENVALKACNKSFVYNNFYSAGGIIPFLRDVLDENTLLLKDFGW